MQSNKQEATTKRWARENLIASGNLKLITHAAFSITKGFPYWATATNRDSKCYRQWFRRCLHEQLSDLPSRGKLLLIFYLQSSEFWGEKNCTVIRFELLRDFKLQGSSISRLLNWPRPPSLARKKLTMMNHISRSRRDRDWKINREIPAPNFSRDSFQKALSEGVIDTNNKI